MYQDQNHSRSANRLLSSLPEAEYQRLEPHLFPLTKTVSCCKKKVGFIPPLKNTRLNVFSSDRPNP